MIRMPATAPIAAETAKLKPTMSRVLMPTRCAARRLAAIAVIGGLALGMLEAFSAGYLSSNYKEAVAFLVILAVLFAMPRGLLGRGKVDRV